MIYCKKCAKKQKHWDNTGTEMEKKLGKFVCAVCKTPYTPKPRGESGEVKPVEKAPYSKPAEYQRSYAKKDYGEGVPKSMFGAWANNLVVAFVDKGVVKTVEEAVELYGTVVDRYNSILNGVGSPTQPAELPAQQTGKLPASPEEEPETSLDELTGADDFDLSDFDL